MEKRGVVDANTPDVEQRLSKRAGATTAEDKAAILDRDTTKTLADAVQAELSKHK